MTSTPTRIFPTDAMFDTPVPVQAGQTYIVSYFTSHGRYDSAEGYFGGALVQPPFGNPVCRSFCRVSDRNSDRPCL